MLSEVIGFLKEIQCNPAQVARKSTRQIRRKFIDSFFSAKPSFVPDIYFLREFADIFNAIELEKDKEFRCLMNAIPDINQMTEEEYPNMAMFLWRHCRSNRTDSNKKFLVVVTTFGAAIELLKKYPGSLWHALMVLHSLQESFEFSNFSVRIHELKKKVLNRILKIHAVLGHETINFNQALALIDNEIHVPSCASIKLTVQHKKVALVILSLYFVSQESVQHAVFSNRQHQIKCFKFLVEIMSHVQNIEEAAVDLPSESAINIFLAAGINAAVQQLTVDDITVLQPKNLGVHWWKFIRCLKNSMDIDNSLRLMTEILASLVNDNDRSMILLIWFNIIKLNLKATADSDFDHMIQEVYANLYHLLLNNNKLPQDAPEPICKNYSGELRDTSRENNSRHVGLGRQPTGHINAVVPLSPIAEEKDGQQENTPVKLIEEEDDQAKISEELMEERPVSPLQLSYSDDGDENDNLSVVSMFSRRSLDLNLDFAPAASIFANHILSYIKNNDVLAVISATLAWYERAQNAGLAVHAASAITTLVRLQDIPNVLFDIVEPHVMRIFYAVIFAKRVNVKVKHDSVLPFYRDACAIFCMLRKSSYFPHKDMDIRYFVYRDTTKNIQPLERNYYPWVVYYDEQRLSDAKENIENQLNIEQQCADILITILAKEPGTLSIEEAGLVVLAFSAYVDENYHSPFYNAIKFLSVTYGISGIDLANHPIVLLSSQAAIANAAAICRELYKRLGLFGMSPEGLDEQQKILYNTIQAIRKKIKPYGPQDQERDADTESVLSGYSNASYHSMRSIASNSSRNSLRMSNVGLGSATMSIILNDAFYTSWSAEIKSGEPLQLHQVRWILQHYSGVYKQNPENKELRCDSVILLRKAFDWLGKLESQPKKEKKSLLWTDPTVEHRFHKNWEVINLIAPKSEDAEAFIQYCLYQKNAVDQYNICLKSYEFDFMIKYLPFLCAYKKQIAGDVECLEHLCAAGAEAGDNREQRYHEAVLHCELLSDSINYIIGECTRRLHDLSKKYRAKTLIEDDLKIYKRILEDDQDIPELYDLKRVLQNMYRWVVERSTKSSSASSAFSFRR